MKPINIEFAESAIFNEKLKRIFLQGGGGTAEQKFQEPAHCKWFEMMP